MFHSFTLLTHEIFFNTGRETLNLCSAMLHPLCMSHKIIIFPGMSIVNGDLARHMPFLKEKVFAVDRVLGLSLGFLKAQPCLCFT